MSEEKPKPLALCTEGHGLAAADLAPLKERYGSLCDRTFGCPRDKCKGYVRIPSPEWAKKILAEPGRFDPYLARAAKECAELPPELSA